MKARRSALVAFLAAFAAAASGCSSETTTTTSTIDGGTTTTVAGDATMHIVSPVDGACFPVPAGLDATIPLTVAFTAASGKSANVFLRAPGFCGDNATGICGHLVVKVNGQINNLGTTPTVSVLLRQFATPYQTFAISVELVSDDGQTLLVAAPNDEGVVDVDAGISLRSSITVDARESCDGSSSSSSSGGGGSSDAGADGG